MHLNFKSNEYADLINNDLYDKLPKTVLAAIAVSFIIRLEGNIIDDIDGYLLDEWKTLYQNKIVLQRPVKP
jgi:hypothetical protein